MKILVVGAGISGLTLACFLRRHAHFDVEIIDKAPDWSHTGFNIGIWDIGRRVLAKLDLDNEFDAISHRISSIKIYDTDGTNKVEDYDFGEFYKKYESTYSHLNRKYLHKLLLNDAGILVRMGLSVTDVLQHDDSVQVTFSDGTSGTYDLVVGADGLHSKVRELVFPEVPIAYTGNRVWISWIPEGFTPKQIITEIVRKESLCYVFDSPHGTCVYLTAPEKPQVFDEPTTRIERVRSHFKDLGSPVPEILDSLTAEEVMPSDIAEIKTETWVRGRVVIIGDAAHAMEPFGGIGASMGMEDAYVLADELCQLHSTTVVERILQRYVERRIPRIRIARGQTKVKYMLEAIKIPGGALMRNLLARVIPTRYTLSGYSILFKNEP